MNNREEFEAWAEPELYALDKREGSDIYRNVITRNAWIGWQAALASQQDHIPNVGKMVQAVNALAAQTGESPESITEWLTDKGGLTQLMLSHFGGISAQVQKPVSQWIPIETAPKNKKIIVRYKNVLGKDRTVFAKYLDKFTEEATEGTDCETDYCEDDDTYYCKEGWVELIDNWDDFSSVYFDSQNVPTHWMPLPSAPEGE